ncbi:proprotein convertase P-domain-containing protein [Dokdonella sp.]|uniref:proprotein convertase P-domain-containing protein n=1 Tax=Dokdonella sp. TaxID=2291710 RepID=UPI0037835A79
MNTRDISKPSVLAVCIAIALGVPMLASAQTREVIGPQSNAKQPPAPPQAPGIKAVWLPPANALFDTGNLADGTTASCSADAGNSSFLQAPGTLFGFGASSAGATRMADDFVVPAGGAWTLQNGYIFSYQTGSTTTSTFTAVSARIWDGPPGDPASNIVCGDDTTNRMTATEFSGVYRMQDTAPGCTRPIMVETIDLSSCPVLNQGTYWLDWQATGSLASGPWAPPLAILNTQVTGNAMQFATGAWGPALDGTSTLGIPFVIAGTSGAGVPTITVDTASAVLTDQCVSAPGQNNGVIEPGETVQIAVPVSALNGDFHNVVASLGPAPAGVTYVTSSVPLGTITGGSSATANFDIRVDTTAACVSSFTLPVNIASDDGSASGSISADVGAPAGFPPTDVPLPIPDNDPAGATSTINVTQDLTLTALTVHVDVTHTWVGDVTLVLHSPAGTAITLLDRPGYTGTGFGCSNNDIHVTFADGQPDPETACDAAGSAAAWPVADAAPVTPLSTLAGESTLGNWTLTASDGAGGDTGTIVSWSLTPTPAFVGTCSICADSDIIFRNGFDGP